MTSPIVDNIPPIVETNGIIGENNSGFPFEDDFEDRHSFRSQLDEIAQRHPEFAQHLHFDQFPLRGRRRRGSDERTQPPPENRRFERPFRSRFEEFGFPFSREFEEPEFYREEVPQYHTYQEQSPPEEPKQETEKEREGGVEKEVKKNIQQSNTVDLGKNQEPVDDQRGQRSMSAPPENRPAQQRFVSSINIPVQNQTGGGPSGDMGAKASQPQNEKPTERVIPIHVEGRDEPVLPKNPNFIPSQQQQPQPQPERIFGRNPSHFTQFLNKGEPQMTPEEYFKQQQRNYQQKHQQNFQQQPEARSQSPQQKQQQPPQEKHQPPQEKQQPPQEKHQQPTKPSQLDQIQSIQKDVSELMNQVEKFEGKPKDKQYLYLDEMLTRNLIKLDNIETEGKENIRQARKEAIKCIESCIGILEAKANANQAKENQEQQPMDVEKRPQEDQDQQQDAQPLEKEKEDDNKNETIETEKKEEEKREEAKEEQTLEVSGVVRSGNVVNTEEPTATPMEVIAESENTEMKKEEEKKEEDKPKEDVSSKAEEKIEEEKKEKKKTGKKKEKADKK